MNIELVVFDMAGTTVRDDDAVNDCLRAALAVHQVKTTREDINAVMGLAKPLAIRTVLERLGGGPTVTEARVRTIHEEFLQRMIFHYQTSSTVESMPHALEVFTQLKEAGVRLALDTGFSRVIVDTILERLGWQGTSLLDATVASDEVLQGRPQPDLLYRAMELTGVRDARTVAKVGDTPSDLHEGTNAGCGLVIGVTNGSHTEAELRMHPHTHLIPSLVELPGLVLGQPLCHSLP